MKTIVVLGMHRSGTSAITRALGLLGAEMGPASHMGHTWENKPLRNVNARLLDAGKGAWDTPPLADDWLDTVPAEGLVDVARERFEAEFGGADIAVWKDPRTCLTFPFWAPVLGESDTVIVLIYRHPFEVARSLETRNKARHGGSFALWERYNREALRFAAGRPTTVIGYGDILEDPQAVMAGLAANLRAWGVDLPNDPATTDMELQQSERHHVSDTAVTDLDVATESQRAIFEALRSLDGPHDSFVPPELPAANPLSLEILDVLNKIRRLRKRAESVDTTAGANRRPRNARNAGASAKSGSAGGSGSAGSADRTSSSTSSTRGAAKTASKTAARTAKTAARSGEKTRSARRASTPTS